MPVQIISTSQLSRPDAMNMLRDAYEWMFEAVEKQDDYLPIQEVDRAARRVKMTEQQKREYALYRRACRTVNVTPVRADFLMGEIDSCVTREMEWQRPQIARGASAGA